MLYGVRIFLGTKTVEVIHFCSKTIWQYLCVSCNGQVTPIKLTGINNNVK